MKISLCMIVRNEERNLPDCVGPVRSLFDEVVIADTGSTDRTKEVITELGLADKVIDSPWHDSFSSARNAALGACTGDWVMWLDADDRIDGINRGNLWYVLKSLTDELAFWVFPCWCPPEREGAAPLLIEHARLFRRLPGVEWRGRVHERIDRSILELGGCGHRADVLIVHKGYQNRSNHQSKIDRNLRLLELDHQDRPNDPDTLYYLARTWACTERPEEVPGWCRKALAVEQNAERDRALRSLLALALTRLGRDQEAEVATLTGLDCWPHETDLLYLRAGQLKAAGRLDAAACLLERMIRERALLPSALGIEGLRGYRALHELGAIRFLQGRYQEAEARWRDALADRPDFEPSLRVLERMRQERAVPA